MLLFSLTLLQASAACLVTGLLLWALLSLAQRRWPALAAQRSVWLGAQLVLVAVFVLPLLPDTRQLSVVPELSVPVSLAGSAPGVQLAMAAPAAGLPSAASWLAWVPSAWGLIYLLGVACAAWRWQRGHAMLRSLLQLAQRRRLHGVDVTVDGANGVVTIDATNVQLADVADVDTLEEQALASVELFLQGALPR